MFEAKIKAEWEALKTKDKIRLRRIVSERLLEGRSRWSERAE